MSIMFLFNTAGLNASSFTLGSGSSATGYDLYDCISGHRANTHRTLKASTETLRQYAYSSDLSIDYCVIARADLLLTYNTTRVRLKQRSSGGSWSYVSGVDYNPLVAGDLIGCKSQDLVINCSPSNLRGIALSTIPASGSEASEISKFYACVSWQGLGDSQKAYTWQDAEPRTTARPLNGGLTYTIERTFSLNFENLSQDQIDEFYSKEQLFYSPFFVYDPDQHHWAWKLEHVILLNVEEFFIARDVYNLSLSFGRLKHSV